MHKVSKAHLLRVRRRGLCPEIAPAALESRRSTPVTLTCTIDRLGQGQAFNIPLDWLAEPSADQRCP